MTFPFRRILLATEHTEFDVGAERLAFELAKDGGTPLLGVLPLVSNDEYEALAPSLVARDEKDAFASGRWKLVMKLAGAASSKPGVAITKKFTRMESHSSLRMLVMRDV